MKAHLEFDIPEDEAELQAAVHAMDHLATTRDFCERLRAMHKHGHSFATADEAIATLYADYCDLMQGYL